MTQNTINFSTDPSGVELLDDLLDPMHENFLTSHSGTSRPAYAMEGTEWLDKTTTPWVKKCFNGTADIIIGTVDPSTLVFTPSAISIPSNAVDNTKLATMASNTVKVNNTGSTGNASDLSIPSSRVLARLASGNIIAATITQIIDLITGTAAQGDVLFRGASAWSRLAAGTAGQVLTTAGAGADPSWANSGGLVLLDTKVASSSASLNFTTGINNTYNSYIFEIDDLKPSVDATNMLVRTSTDGGVSYDSGASDYSFTNTTMENGNTVTGFGNNAANSITITGGVNAFGNAAGETICGQIRLYSPSNSVNRKKLTWDIIGTSSAATAGEIHINGGGARKATADVDALQILPSSGNWVSGTVRLYGLKM